MKFEQQFQPKVAPQENSIKIFDELPFKVREELAQVLPEEYVPKGFLDQPQNDDEEHEDLLALLPEELRVRWEDAPLDTLRDVIQKRGEISGAEKIFGYHFSKHELDGKPALDPGLSETKGTEEPAIYYSDNLRSLPPGHYRYLTIVEGSGTDPHVTEGSPWRKRRATDLKVLATIKLNDEILQHMQKQGVFIDDYRRVA